MKKIQWVVLLLFLLSCQNSNTFIRKVQNAHLPEWGERSIAEVLESYCYFKDDGEWYFVKNREQDQFDFDDPEQQAKRKAVVRFVGLLDSLHFRQQCISYFTGYKNNHYPPDHVTRRRQVDNTLSDVLKSVESYGLALDFAIYKNGTVKLIALGNIINKKNSDFCEAIPFMSDPYDSSKVKYIVHNESFPLAFAYIHKGNWQEW